MRLCRFSRGNAAEAGIYADSHVIPLAQARSAFEKATGRASALPENDDLLALLPPDGEARRDMDQLYAWATDHSDDLAAARLPVDSIQLLVPIPRPNKLFLLAGNYAAHIQEGGGVAAERAETFPYVFMKPPTTTLTHPGQPIRIPAVSPQHVDWELELAVVIGRRVKGVKEAEALSCVAGYTVINDISDRKFQPNPQRKKRDKDGFFDWLHGKWHDSFCPCGPCITSAAAIADPQNLAMELRVNGLVKQKATTGQQIFPVAAVIEFISSFVTLEPGDIISTGTAAGVGNTTGQYLHAGDYVEAEIGSIGKLVSPVTGDT